MFAPQHWLSVERSALSVKEFVFALNAER